MWYEVVGPNTPLTQGDLISNCPILAWQAGSVKMKEKDELEVLKDLVDAIAADVIVMTQACDLENNKVNNVTLCPHVSLSQYRLAWQEDKARQQQIPSDKAWIKHCDFLCKGFSWNVMMLNGCHEENHITENRVVYFHEVFTVPVSFLESLMKRRGVDRLRLRPPYREHLSQAFARFFMRVGLPTPVEKTW